MALRAFLVVGGLTTLMDSRFQSKTELLSDPKADSPSRVSAGCDVHAQNQTLIQKYNQTEFTIWIDRNSCKAFYF